MEKVLITGGSGTVGTVLSSLLRDKGYEVMHLSRNKTGNEKYKTYLWDWEKETIENEAIETVDYIIHLAGTGIIDKSWSLHRKKLIKESRVNSGRFLLKAVKEKSKKLKAFISASAVGYYGTLSSDRIYTETDAPADDFLASVCRDWEIMADEFRTIGVRSVKLRAAVVLSASKGIISDFKKAAKFGLIAPFGKGNQYIPWIHIDDLCALYLKAIEDPRMSGAYNAVAPQHLTNNEFTLEFARAMDKKLWLPNVPAFILKIIFGERSRLLLMGSRVSADKVIKTGFVFLFPELKTALEKLLVKD